jgi:hypothetical protein
VSTQRADEAELIEVLDRLCSRFARRDADAVLSVCALEPDLIVVTSEEPLLRGPDELCAFLDRYLEGDTTYSWKWDRRDVSIAGSTAWLLAEGTETAAERRGRGAATLPDDDGARAPRRPLARAPGPRIVTPLRRLHLVRRRSAQLRDLDAGAHATRKS